MVAPGDRLHEDAAVELDPSTPAAIYDRIVTASVARIWENVLDWEHVPWLHRTSFGAVRLLDESPAGWRGWITTRSRRPLESLVDVRLDRPTLRYLTRTVEGDGAGTEIWTTLEPAGARATSIHVEFAFPCDAHGWVDLDSLGEMARANYFYARTVIGREFHAPVTCTVPAGDTE